MSFITPDQSIDQLLSYNRFLEPVLERFELRGGTGAAPLLAECEGKCADLRFLLEMLHAFDAGETFDPQALRSFPLPVILDYLYRTHDYYLQHRLEEIEQSIESLVRNYGGQCSLMPLLRPVYQNFRQEVAEHIAEEESHLFPYINYLYNSEKFGSRYAARAFAQPKPCQMSDFIEAHEHEDGLAALKLLIENIAQQHPPLKETMDFRIFRTQLEALLRDMKIHERVENEVLIPKALRTERALTHS
jgi:regulator of cell morphogenesis and NO signaling